MKIYIETEMTELPKSCGECDFILHIDNEILKQVYESKIDSDFPIVCYINRKNTKNNKLPKWCPLRTEIDIAEKAKESNDE